MNHDSCRHAALLSKRAEHTHEENNNKTRQDNKTRGRLSAKELV
jgi:hypothetical protein